MEKTKKSFEPTVGEYLDEEERQIIEAVNDPSWVPVSVMTPEKKKEIMASARATMNEQRVKISIRLAASDLVRLKAKAMREGMPYQTLIGSILHKAVTR